MSRVFIPQHPSRFDKEAGRYVLTADLSNVYKFGQPVFMLPMGGIRSGGPTRKMIETLEAAMFDFAPTDYLLATGDPIAISAAAIIAGRHTNGQVLILRWQRHTEDYKVFPLDMRGA